MLQVVYKAMYYSTIVNHQRQFLAGWYHRHHFDLRDRSDAALLATQQLQNTFNFALSSPTSSMESAGLFKYHRIKFKSKVFQHSTKCDHRTVHHKYA